MIGLNKVKILKATILVLLVVLINSVVTVNLAAQEVSPSSGSRTITTYVLANTNSLGGGRLRVQFQYSVRWRASICREGQPVAAKISAHVTDYTITGVEHDGSFIPANEIGGSALERGIEVESLPAGVMPVIHNHETGNTKNMVQMPLAGLRSRPVCDGTEIYSGWENFSVQIENSDDIFERRGVVRITWDLLNEITGRQTYEELTSGASGNNQNTTPHTNTSQRSEQNRSKDLINGSTSTSISSTQNNRNRQSSYSSNTSESRSENNESEEEYRSWQDSHQSEMMRLLDELDKQSERQEQIRQKQMQATEQAVMNVAGTINQIREQRQEERAQNRLNQVIYDYEKTVGTVIRNFNLEASAYEEAVRNLNSFINEHGRRLLRGHRESITNLMNSMVDEINTLYEQKNEFIYYNSPNADERMLSNAIETNTYIDFEHIYDHRLAFDQVVSKSGFDWTFERILEDLDDTYSSRSLINDFAEIAKTLDYDRPSVDRKYGYYSPYLPREEEYLIEALKNTNDAEHESELIEAYEKYYTNGNLTEEFSRIIKQKEELRNERLALIERAEFHESEAARVRGSFRGANILNIPFSLGSMGLVGYGLYKNSEAGEDDEYAGVTEFGIGFAGVLIGYIWLNRMDKPAEEHLKKAKQLREEANQLTFSINKLSIGKDKFALGFRIDF